MDVHISGELTGNNINDFSKMTYNSSKGIYEKTLMLKQGFYSYQYVTKDVNAKNAKADTELTEGNYWETENQYTVFVYYRSFNGRHDELVGLTSANSRLGQTQIRL